MSMWDDEAGYDLDDPKHPTYGERMADWADLQRKRDKEDQHRAEWERLDADATPEEFEKARRMEDAAVSD